jgi:hypothetical protein
MRWVKSSALSRVQDVWENAFSDLSTNTQSVEVTAEYNSGCDEFVIDYSFGSDVHIPARDAAIVVFEPGGFGRPLPIERISETVFRAHVHCNHTVGMFRVLPLNGSSAFPQFGHTDTIRNSTALAQTFPLLREVSQLTGGRFNPEPPSIFVPDGKIVVRKLQLWPALVVLSVLLFLLGWNQGWRRDFFDRIRTAIVNAGGRGNRDGFGHGISFPYRRQHPH